MLEEGKNYLFQEVGGVKSLRVYFREKWAAVSLDGYQMERLIGAGANGVTVKARHTLLNRDVAIKVWLPREQYPERYQEQFLGEIHKIGELKHDHIASIHDGQIIEGLCVAVYEYFDGIPLKDWLQSALYSTRDCWKLCAEILDAVAFYQDHGIIHGDLHSGNILVSKFPAPLSPCLIDFGASALSSEPDVGKQRELFMIADLTRRMLKAFNAVDAKTCPAYVTSSQFAFRLDKKHKRIARKAGDFFAFDFTPRMMTETMRRCLEINDFLTQDVKRISVRGAVDLDTVFRDLPIDLSERLVYAPYLDFQAFLTEAVFPRISVTLPKTWTLPDGKTVNAKEFFRQTWTSVLLKQLEEYYVFPDAIENDAECRAIEYSSFIAYAELVRRNYAELLPRYPQLSGWKQWAEGRKLVVITESSPEALWEMRENFYEILADYFEAKPEWEYFLYARMWELQRSVEQGGSWEEELERVGLKLLRRVWALHFSPTGNTERVALTTAEVIADSLGVPLESVSLNPPDARQKEYVFGPTDFLVFACPVYAGRLPNKILPDIKACLRGDNTPSAALVTFGNRAFDNALAELVSVLTDNGFRVVGAGAVVGEHAFTDKLGGGRPGVTDLRALRTFAGTIADAVRNGTASGVTVPGDPAAPYYVPKGADGLPARFLKAKPKVDLSRCHNCGTCARVCPMGAIDPGNVSDVPGTCIKCQACVSRCTRRARFFDDPAFLSHVAMLERTFTEPKENAFFYGGLT